MTPQSPAGFIHEWPWHRVGRHQTFGRNGHNSRYGTVESPSMEVFVGRCFFNAVSPQPWSWFFGPLCYGRVSSAWASRWSALTTRETCLDVRPSPRRNCWTESFSMRSSSTGSPKNPALCSWVKERPSPVKVWRQRRRCERNWLERSEKWQRFTWEIEKNQAFVRISHFFPSRIGKILNHSKI